MEKVETDKLMREDVVVVWGGANDIGKNASPDDLKHIPKFMQNRRHTNVLLMSVPIGVIWYPHPASTVRGSLQQEIT